jgi:hypothetical protein
VGAARLGSSLLPLIDPLLSTARLDCDPCRLRTDPVLLLDQTEARQKAWQTPGRERQIIEQISKPKVRLMLFVAQVVRALPFFVMFLALAMALRSFAQAGFNPAAVRWIRRAALGAIVWTLAEPVAMSIRWTALSPITHGRDSVHLVLGGNELILGTLIAGAAWVVGWALEEALGMQRDLEEYV